MNTEHYVIPGAQEFLAHARPNGEPRSDWRKDGFLGAQINRALLHYQLKKQHGNDVIVEITQESQERRQPA